VTNALGTLLYTFIARRGLTAEEFAGRVGVAKSTISKLKSKPPSPKTLASLAEWAKILDLKTFEAKELVEEAHLSRATSEIRSLVERLRRQHSQVVDENATLGNEVATLRDQVASAHDQLASLRQELATLRDEGAALVELCRRRGIEVPQIPGDGRPLI
jgi:transcriptional regulator with XRE-family HTH domain